MHRSCLFMPLAAVAALGAATPTAHAIDFTLYDDIESHPLPPPVCDGGLSYAGTLATLIIPDDPFFSPTTVTIDQYESVVWIQLHFGDALNIGGVGIYIGAEANVPRDGLGAIDPTQFPTYLASTSGSSPIFEIPIAQLRQSNTFVFGVQSTYLDFFGIENIPLGWAGTQIDPFVTTTLGLCPSWTEPPWLDDVDGDGDGVPDGDDNCPTTANAHQANLDGDGAGDRCDLDADGDGDDVGDDCDDLDPSRHADAIELCFDGVDNDCDTETDVYDDSCDSDGDLVPDGDDNCPDDANEAQLDTDLDGAGDACDPDDDGDGAPDCIDNCPVVANPTQADHDGDGTGDACDADGDGDGLDDFTEDECPFTELSDREAGVPSRALGTNRWVLVDGRFTTTRKNPTGRRYTLAQTGGCSCAQIIESCGYGQGHTKFGCSNSVMDWWTGKYERAGRPRFSCEGDGHGGGGGGGGCD